MGLKGSRCARARALRVNPLSSQVLSGGAGMKCVNFGVGGNYSRGHKQDENASIDEIIQCRKAVALLFMRKLDLD